MHVILVVMHHAPGVVLGAKEDVAHRALLIAPMDVMADVIQIVLPVVAVVKVDVVDVVQIVPINPPLVVRLVGKTVKDTVPVVLVDVKMLVLHVL